MSGDGTAEATIGPLATGSATSRGNALGVYAQNDDVAQTVSFFLRFKPAPALDWVDLESLTLQDVAANGGVVYQLLRLSIPVSGESSLQLRAVASGAGSAPVSYRVDLMEVR